MRPGVLLLVVLALPLVAASGGPGGNDEEADPSANATELVNTLLGSLMGGGAITAEGLQREVAEVGGIPFRQDVPVAFMSHDELVAYLGELLETEYPPGQAEADRRLLEAFDLLEPDVDLRALRLRVLEENIVGFYDERPGRQQLFAVSEEQAFTPMNQIVLAHELRHALQDQHAPLHWQLPEEVGDFDDRRLAWICLLEGDATLLMENLVLGRMEDAGLGRIAGGVMGGGYSDLLASGLADIPGAPPVIRDHLVMPYLVGRDLARAIEDRDGAEGLRAAWRRPPDSTEQVLHPDKFFGREVPREVPVGEGPREGRLVSQGVLGELLLRSLLDEGDTSPGAAGWGGDAWWLWDVDGATVLSWRSIWDDRAEAVEFAASLENRFVRKRGAGVRRGAWILFQGDGGWRFAVRRDDDVVDLASSDSPEELLSFLQE